LGPLLSNIFANDVSLCVKHSNMQQFADDVFKQIKSHVDCVLLQEDITAISSWCLQNKLTSKAKRTCVIFLSRKKRVYIDSSLSFTNHVSNWVSSCSRLLGLFSRITRRFKEPSCIVRIYTSIVRSKLEFGSVV
ncbi:uncharacterized protein LOC121835057, partial [Ixodes scapularis]|uniref:uncharacterized protein LOC121835057 n=1 Tax=Ixodes scapularis TaxID=6945 RepID=UPI001C3872B3